MTRSPLGRSSDLEQNPLHEYLWILYLCSLLIEAGSLMQVGEHAWMDFTASPIRSIRYPNRLLWMIASTSKPLSTTVILRTILNVWMFECFSVFTLLKSLLTFGLTPYVAPSKGLYEFLKKNRGDAFYGYILMDVTVFLIFIDSIGFVVICFKNLLRL